MKKIFILHGWTYMTTSNDPLKKWDPFMEQLISINYRPVLLKIPGLTANVNEVWNLEGYVDWLKKVLDKEKGKVILIGHSNGGRIAIAFAEIYPQKVEQLILIDSAGIYHNELPLRLKRFVFKYIAKIGKKITSSEKLKVLLYKFAREGDYKNATPAQRQTMLSLINFDLSPVLNKISTPTLIIWGEQDKVTPLSDGRLMNKLLKNSEIKIIPDAKHSPQYTHSKEVAKIIYEYL